MMDVAPECIPCTVQSCLRLLQEGDFNVEKREDLLRLTLQYLATADWRQSPPALARDLHAKLREAAATADPYLGIKARGNAMMIERVDILRDRLARSGDPFDTALRLAVAGNVIDFGARHLYDPDATIERVLEADLAINHGATLRRDLEQAESVLYIGDNAGEIILDGLFLETIKHPAVTFVVRGGPVINDATVEDARAAGIPDLARVISTGDDSPGVILDRASDEFLAAFAAADLVIAKGQGNLEGLWGAVRDVYFLLTVKCERIGRRLEAPVGEFIVWKYEASSESG